MLRQNVVIGMVPRDFSMQIAQTMATRYGVRIEPRHSQHGTELVAREIRRLETLVRMREYLMGRVDAALEMVGGKSEVKPHELAHHG